MPNPPAKQPHKLLPWRKNFVKIRCLHQGCPRTTLLDRQYLESYVPKQTATIYMFCPWHAKEGWKAYPEFYYDANGRELNWETGKPKLNPIITP